VSCEAIDDRVAKRHIRFMSASKSGAPGGHRTVMRRLRDYLLTGLLALGPTAVTLWVFLRLLYAVDRWLGDNLRVLGLSAQRVGFPGDRLPGLGLAATLLLLILVGWIVSLLGGWIGGRSLYAMWEHLLSRIPGVGMLYGSTKSLGQAFVSQRREAFKQVVLVPWPSPGIWRVGFIAAKPGVSVTEKLGEDFEVVFVPHSPNPASGFVHYVPRASIIYLDWTIEEGLRVIISGGVVQPGASAAHPEIA
jgi:uncharacterized membrane protein